MNVLTQYPILTFYAAKPGWQWRNKKGNFIPPSKMSTNYLYNTMCIAYSILVLKRRTAGSFYTDKYLLDTLLETGHELVFRKNTHAEIFSDLTKVQNYLAARSRNERSTSLIG